MVRLTQYQKALLQDLNAVGVQYLVVGGKAMQAYGIKRESLDLDLWVSRFGGNPDRLYPLLHERLHSTSSKLSPDWLRISQRRVALPSDSLPDHEIDILTSIDDLDFNGAFERATWMRSDDMSLPVASLQDLVEIKRVSHGRNQDPKRKAIDARDLEVLVALIEQ